MDATISQPVSKKTKIAPWIEELDVLLLKTVLVVGAHHAIAHASRPNVGLDACVMA